MKKLTEEQEQSIANISEQKKEIYLEQNKTILFDIGKVTAKGKQIREDIDKLVLANAEIKRKVKEQFDADVQKVREFLGEYADALVLSEEELYQYSYHIGANDDNKVWVTYAFGRHDYIDWNNYQEINGNKVQEYKEYEIDTNADGYGTEHHPNFEAMFNDADVVEMFEIAVQDYIAYTKPKEKKDFLNGIN